MLKISIHLALLGAFAFPLSAQTVALARVSVPDSASFQALLALDLDIAPDTPEPGDVDVLLWNPLHHARLLASGLPFEVLYDDYPAHLQAGLGIGPDTFPALGSGSMGGYFTFAETIAAFDCLQAAHPAIMAPKVSLGQSYEGRDVWLYKISDNPGIDEAEPEVELDAWHHAREPGTATSMVHFVATILAGYGTDPEATALIDNREIWLIPCVNPDGVVRNQTTNPGGGGMWRKNRRPNGDGTFGVDLNRNYAYQWGYSTNGSSTSTSSETYRGPSPQSELEVQAIVNWAATRPISAAQNAHTYTGLHMYPYGYATGAVSPEVPAYQEICGLMSQPNGYRVGSIAGILYLANGVSVDWWEAVRGAAAFTTEIGSVNDGFWPPSSRILPLAIDNFVTFNEVAWYAGSNVVVKSWTLSQVSGNGNPWPEPGEVFDLQVTFRNRGRLATAGAVTVGLSPLTTLAGVVVGAGATAGPMASMTDAPVTLRIALPAATPAPASIAMEVAATFDGITRRTRLPLVSGIPSTVVSHDFETDQGWTVGAPGDLGTGAWVRVNPVGTVLSGAPWQSEDDHTPGAGVTCFVTGNGSAGGSASASDLDGITTLTSPVFDLGNVLHPVARFWVWFTNDDQDDTLWFEISNDGGTAWEPAGLVRGRRNTWSEHVLPIQDFLLPSSKTRFRFRAGDNPENSVTEAALDDFSIEGFSASLTLGVTAVGGPGSTVDLSLSAPATPGHGYAITFSTTAVAGFPLPDGRIAGVDDGPFLLLPFQLPAVFENWSGALNAAGTAAPRLFVPGDPGFSGFAFFVGGLSIDPSTAAIWDLTGTRHIVIP